MEKRINVAIAGVGNIASGLIQGVEYLRTNEDSCKYLLHPSMANYGVNTIHIVAAFDVAPSLSFTV